jgi:hypothetical protein
MLTLTGCANTHNPLDDYEQVEPAAILDVPSANASVYPVEQVERGRYLVALLSCGSCHTDGVLQIDLLEIAEGARQAVCIRLRRTGIVEKRKLPRQVHSYKLDFFNFKFLTYMAGGAEDEATIHHLFGNTFLPLISGWVLQRSFETASAKQKFPRHCPQRNLVFTQQRTIADFGNRAD